MTAHDAMRILETSTDSLVLDVWRQASPLSSAGSSPTPISLGTGTQMHDSTSVSSSMSKSDTLAVHSNSFDTSGYMDRGTDNSKNLRSSGSQTDSLDSPGPSPCKNLRNQESDKGKHSLPMLDKAIIKVERIFRTRHKTQDRSKDSEDKKDFDDDQLHGSQEPGKSLHKLVGDCGTQVSLSCTDKNVAEFPGSIKYMSKIDDGNSDVSINQESSKTCKRDWELDSNSGTWPKTRVHPGQSTSGPPPFIFSPGYRPNRDRPSIRNIFYGSSESSTYETKCPPETGGAGNLQSSDSSIVNSDIVFHSPLAQSSSAFSPSSAPVVSQSEHNSCLPLSVTLPKVATPSVPVPKSHFTVGILHGKNMNISNSTLAPSWGPPVFVKPASTHMYGTVPSYRHTGHRGSLVSTHYSQLQPTGVFPNSVSVAQDFRLETAVRAAPKTQQVLFLLQILTVCINLCLQHLDPTSRKSLYHFCN